jgi:hypothetical protein
VHIFFGIVESPMFQSAEYAVRAHVPVLAWDRISLYRGIRTKTEKQNTSMVCRSESSGQVVFLQPKQQVCSFLVFQQSDVLKV